MKLTGNSWDWIGAYTGNLILSGNNIHLTADVKSSGEGRMLTEITYADTSIEQINVNFSEGISTPSIIINYEKTIQSLMFQFTLKHDNGTLFIDNLNILV